MSKNRAYSDKLRKEKNDLQAEREALEMIAFGKVQPHATQIEEAVLGACLLEKEAVKIAAPILVPEDFYSEAHKKIFAAILLLDDERKPVDLLTVMETLTKTGDLNYAGGPAYLAELSNKIASAANTEYHCWIVKEKSFARQCITSAISIQTMAYDLEGETSALKEFVEGKLFKLSQSMNPSVTVTFRERLKDRLDELIELKKLEPGQIIGVPTGFDHLDQVTSGFQNSDLICIAARPSMGKSALVKSLIYNQAMTHKKSVALFSLEVKASQVADGLIAIDACMNGRRVMQANNWSERDEQRIYDSIDRMGGAKLYIDDKSSINISYLASKLRELKAKYDIDIAYIDYLQIMDIPGQNRDIAIGIVSRRLKGLAKELNIPIVFLSQLSRGLLKTADKRPTLGDLRESGNIENDCDMIMFIHRPWYYNIKEDSNGASTKKVGELIIAKHRHGELCTVDLQFINWMPRFLNPGEEVCEDVPAPGGDDDDLPF